MYTLENQQIFWNESYYMLNQGIPTGGKHCVPLANIFLSFILIELMENDNMFNNDFNNNLKIWKRFIDDCLGMFMGREKKFKKFYNKIVKQYAKYDLEITCEQSKESIEILDIEIFKINNQLHTREKRKETAANSYLRFGSAHPDYTFKGIIKSQMCRLRRLCSREEDFQKAISGLKVRCINSGYDVKLVEELLKSASKLKREIKAQHNQTHSNVNKIRWITLSQSYFEKDISNFTQRMNKLLKPEKIQFEVIKTTAPNIGRLLFNNFEKPNLVTNCSCIICDNGAKGDDKVIVSSTSKIKYHINPNINC